LASKQSRSNRSHCLPYRASGKRMRVRISAHPMAGSVGPLALGPLHFEDAQESISRKHGQLVDPISPPPPPPVSAAPPPEILESAPDGLGAVAAVRMTASNRLNESGEARCAARGLEGALV